MATDLDYLPKLPSEAARTTGIGCIGAGFIMADCHLVAYRQAGFNPVAIASRDHAKAQAVAERHSIPKAYADWRELLDDPAVEVVDVAVPPDIQIEVVREIVRHKQIRGLLAQKPLGVDYAQAEAIVELCRDAGITLAVNQNMRFDQSIRACKDLLRRGLLGEPVLATIDMRAIPHWMPWQERQGWVTLRIMSIHHLDMFRYLFGDPQRIFASVRPDPRTKFPHKDGIALYILEYENGLRASSWDDVWAGPAKEGAAADLGIRWRVEGTTGMARGTIGWPSYPERTPSTLDYTTSTGPEAGIWISPRWNEVWFPDAFVGPMADLLCALEEGREPEISGEDNLKTMALVDAAYQSVKERRAVRSRPPKDKWYEPTPEEIDGAPKKFSYEFRMFRRAVKMRKRLTEHKRLEEKSLRNMALETALLHARNLLDFFTGGPSTQDDVYAAHFLPPEVLGTDNWWKSTKLQELAAQVGAINKSLSHLTYTRTSEKPSWNLQSIEKQVVKAYSEFRELLPEKDRTKWPDVSRIA